MTAYSVGLNEIDQITLTAQGLISENWPRQTGRVGTIMVGGTAYFMLVPLRAGQIVTSVSIIITTQGATMTLSKVGLYTKAGVRLGSSADQGAAWETVGTKTADLTSPVTVPTTDGYYAAVVAAGGTLPTLLVGSNLVVVAGQVGAGAAAFGIETGQTDLDATATIVPGTAPLAFWIGVS